MISCPELLAHDGLVLSYDGLTANGIQEMVGYILD
jgi:hypothetical protein